MFGHPKIQTYAFEDITLDRDVYLMDEKWMVKFERALIKSVEERGPTAYKVGYYSYASFRAIGDESAELIWYPNTHDRFHQVRITLPRSAFVTCVGAWEYDYKPLIFVKGDWLTHLHLRSNSVFALVDAIDVKRALAKGTVTRPKLAALRDQIDRIAAANPDVGFVSFADSLLLKSNFTVGQFDQPIKYTYEPEKILRLLPAIREAYQTLLGLDIYAVVTQGHNEYYDDGLLHISASGNHMSLNSLGLPFAQTQAIEQAARAAIRGGIHEPADFYLDESFYHSLRFKYSFEKNEEPKFLYKAPMTTGNSYYFPVSAALLADKLETL
jgi:hypothetical protein